MTSISILCVPKWTENLSQISEERHPFPHDAGSSWIRGACWHTSVGFAVMVVKVGSSMWLLSQQRRIGEIDRCPHGHRCTERCSSSRSQRLLPRNEGESGSQSRWREQQLKNQTLEFGAKYGGWQKPAGTNDPYVPQQSCHGYHSAGAWLHAHP